MQPTNILKWGISFYFSKEQNQANIRLHHMCTMCHLGIHLTQRQRHKTLILSIQDLRRTQEDSVGCQPGLSSGFEGSLGTQRTLSTKQKPCSTMLIHFLFPPLSSQLSSPSLSFSVTQSPSQFTYRGRATTVETLNLSLCIFKWN